MKVDGAFLRGKVARRILALFVLSAFVPALALAVLSLSQVRALLTEQSKALLAETSKAYALNVYERLLLAHQGLQQVALGLQDGAIPRARLRQALQQTYSRLTIVGPAATPVPILGEPLSWPQVGPAAQAHLAADESVLIVQRDGHGRARIILLQLIDAAKPGRFALAAELNPEQLWGAADSFAESIDLCVLADTGLMLFCSKHLSESDTAAIARSASASWREPVAAGAGAATIADNGSCS